MHGEYSLKRAQLRGYMFEIIILELLNRNGFSLVDSHTEIAKIREIRNGFVEMKGRGCWHQIDCPCDYDRLVPFIYPIRMLGEVKFRIKPISKNHIREFIGVLKDIQENYFVLDELNADMQLARKTEIGVFFAANGFDAESEKLAYAHGIKTISYENNPIIQEIVNYIVQLESNFISVRAIENGNFNDFKYLLQVLLNNDTEYPYYAFEHGFRPADGYQYVIRDISRSLYNIRSSFIGTTSTGVFLHFISEDPFPEHLFYQTDVGQCEVYFGRNELGGRSYYLTISGDPNKGRFYFSPPLSLDGAAMFGGNNVLNEKERLFQTVNVSINLNNIQRTLTLHINNEWLEAARRNNR